MSFNEKIKRWFGFPLAKTKLPSYLEEVQSVLEERLKEIEVAEKETNKKAPAKKPAAAPKASEPYFMNVLRP